MYIYFIFLISFCTVASSYGESYRIGMLYSKHSENKKVVETIVDKYNETNNKNKLLLYSISGSGNNDRILIENLVRQYKLDAIICAGDIASDIVVEKYSELNSFPILLCNDKENENIFKTFDNIKLILQKYESNKSEKENKLKLLSDIQKKEFINKTKKFRNSIQAGDETTYGMVIEVKKPLAKVQTTNYIVSHYTEWKTKYNQYGSYKDPEVATQSNPVPVEKWFKISDLFPVE